MHKFYCLVITGFGILHTGGGRFPDDCRGGDLQNNPLLLTHPAARHVITFNCCECFKSSVNQNAILNTIIYDIRKQ
jgi:hypothetical protein